MSNSFRKTALTFLATTLVAICTTPASEAQSSNAADNMRSSDIYNKANQEGSASRSRSRLLIASSTSPTPQCPIFDTSLVKEVDGIRALGLVLTQTRSPPRWRWAQQKMAFSSDQLTYLAL